MVVLERILEILAALALPLAIGELFRRALRWVGAGELQRVPAVNGAANLLGLIVGVLLIVNAGDLALFDWHRFFTTESPWNLPLSAFLAERANPLA